MNKKILSRFESTKKRVEMHPSISILCAGPAHQDQNAVVGLTYHERKTPANNSQSIPRSRKYDKNPEV